MSRDKGVDFVRPTDRMGNRKIDFRKILHYSMSVSSLLLGLRDAPIYVKPKKPSIGVKFEERRL